MPAPRLWLVAPIFRDVESFTILRERLLAVLNQRSQPASSETRFVVVDDSGGADPDVARLRAVPGVRVLTTPFNLGHQRALVFGLRRLERELGSDDVVVTLDADGEDRPEDLPALLAALDGSAGRVPALVLARRTKRQVGVGFQVLYFFFKLLFRSLTGVVIRTGNYAAFRGVLVSRILFHPHFDLSYSASLISLGLDVELVPCPRGSRYAGRSRMDYYRLVRHGIGMLMPFLDRIAVRALLAFSFSFGAGISLSLLALLLLPFTHTSLPWWMTPALAATLAISFISIGNFLVLFATYAQSQSASLRHLDRPEPQPRD
jgi:glycosyltransferase involved in cell wall biosynthesis